MTDNEKLSCLIDRPCTACKFHKEEGCSKWTCVFEEKSDVPERKNRMTNEEAIAILEKEAEFLYGEDKPHNRTAFDMAIKALSVPDREKGTDLISRDEVMKAFYECRPRLATDNSALENKLMCIPSADKEKGEWIPVSERLPEESLNSVIGWDMYRERCVFVQYIDGHFQITGRAESFNIVAWQPLPEPYKE